MKINIRKFAGGGAAFPWVSYNGGTDVNNTPDIGLVGMDDEDDDSSKSSSSSSGQLTDKGLMSLMSGLNGLPSDMNAIWQQLSQFYQAKDLGLDIGSLSTQYIGALQKIKEANYHKQLFDKAYSALEQNDGLSEYAVSASGKVISVDNGKIEYNDLDDVLNGNIKGSLVTNRDLLKLRAESIAGNDNLITLAEIGIGIEKVSKLIKDQIYKLGTNTTSQEGKISVKLQEGAQLLEKLQQEGVDISQALQGGIYDSKVLTKDQKQNAAAALNYIYTTLPENVKTILALHAGGKQQSLNLIAQRISSTLDSESQTKFDLIEDINGNKIGSTSKSNSESDKDRMTWATYIVRGEGGTYGTTQLMGKPGYSMTVEGISYPNLGPNPLERYTSLDTMMQKKGNEFYKGSNYAITFGDSIVKGQISDPESNKLESVDIQDKIVIDNTSAIRIILPVKEVNGTKVPDLDYAESHKELISSIQRDYDKGQFSEETLKLIREAGLLDLSGNIDVSKFQPYLVMDAKTTDKYLKHPGNWVQKTDMTAEDETLLEKVLSTEDSKEDVNYSGFFGMLGGLGYNDDLYKGRIYIPITQNVAQTYMSDKTIKQGQVDFAQSVYQSGDFLMKSNNTGGDIFNYD